MAKTPAQRGALGRRRKTTGQKAAAAKRLRANAQRIAATNKLTKPSPEEDGEETAAAARKRR